MSGPIKRYSVLLYGAVPFLFLIVLAGIFPEQLWGISWFVDVPFYQLVGLGLVLFLGIIGIGISARIEYRIPKVFQFLILLSIVVASVGVQWSFPIVFDEYGNAFQYREFSEIVQEYESSEAVNDVFELSIAPSTGRKTVLGAYTIVSYYTGLKYGEVFKWAGLIFGLMYSVFWLLIIKHLRFSFTVSWVMMIIGCFVPLTFVFFNHQEIYAPVFASVMLWLFVYLRFSESGNQKLLWLLLVHSILNIKLHPVSVFLLVPLGVQALSKFSESIKSNGISWGWMLKWIHLPVFIAGAILYFIMLKDHADPRFLTGVADHERIFLPLFSPEAPLDRYNLLSWNHILDYLNVLLLWSLPGLGFMWALEILKARVNWNQSQIVILGSTFLLMAVFLFMVNPLLSMPMDLDLFMFPGLIALLVLALLIKQVKEDSLLKRALPILFLSLVVTLPLFLVNAEREMLSRRLERVGKRVFKTYYLHSSRIILTGIGISGHRDQYIKRKNLLIDDLQKYALLGNDPKYANLYYDNAMYHSTISGNVQLATEFANQALAYYPELMEAWTLLYQIDDRTSLRSKGIQWLRKDKKYLEAKKAFEQLLVNDPKDQEVKVYLMEAHFLMNQYYEAYNIARGLMKDQYPSATMSIRRAIHCALEAGLTDSLRQHTDEYLAIDPMDPTIKKLQNGLEAGAQMDSLKLLFRSSVQQ